VPDQYYSSLFTPRPSYNIFYPTNDRSVVVLAMQSDEVRAPARCRPGAGRQRSRPAGSVLGEL